MTGTADRGGERWIHPCSWRDRKWPGCWPFAAAIVLLTAAGAASATAANSRRDTVRFETYNASLNRNAEGQLIADLSSPGATTVGSTQARVIAEVVQQTRPDVLLINEFDYDDDDPGGASRAGRLFQDNFLSVGQNGASAINYPYRFIAPSNTGIPSGFDLDNNGTVGGTVGTIAYGNDSFGFGEFPGKYGMALYSKYPILVDQARTFQEFLWKDMPGALLPERPQTADPNDLWYSPEELAVFRLSSKSHWDVPVRIGGRTVHVLASHPTPPVFDGPEDRNGRRNHDEIRFWADYILPSTSGYIYDDEGDRGGLRPGAMFVIMGDQNADPLDGDSVPGAIQQLLGHPLVNTRLTPASLGGPEQSILQDRLNDSHRGDPAYDTADFCDFAPCGPGNLRVDYVLPRRNMKIVDSGVFWPTVSDPLYRLIGVFPFPSSDHKPVWIDVQLPG